MQLRKLGVAALQRRPRARPPRCLMGTGQAMHGQRLHTPADRHRLGRREGEPPARRLHGLGIAQHVASGCLHQPGPVIHDGAVQHVFAARCIAYVAAERPASCDADRAGQTGGDQLVAQAAADLHRPGGIALCGEWRQATGDFRDHALLVCDDVKNFDAHGRGGACDHREVGGQPRHGGAVSHVGVGEPGVDHAERAELRQPGRQAGAATLDNDTRHEGCRGGRRAGESRRNLRRHGAGREPVQPHGTMRSGAVAADRMQLGVAGEPERHDAVQDNVADLATVRYRTDRAQRLAGEHLEAAAAIAAQDRGGEHARHQRQPVAQRLRRLGRPIVAQIAQRDGCRGRLQMRLRRSLVVPQRNHRIAVDAQYVAAMRGNGVDHGTEIIVEQLAEPLRAVGRGRRHQIRQRGRVDDVDKQHDAPHRHCIRHVITVQRDVEPTAQQP